MVDGNVEKDLPDEGLSEDGREEGWWAGRVRKKEEKKKQRGREKEPYDGESLSGGPH